MLIKLIGSDYDRVLTDENLNFDFSLLPLIEKIREKGVKFGIITGRRWRKVENIKDYFDFIVYENGYFLYNGSHKKLFNEKHENIVKNVRKILDENGMEYISGEMIISLPIEKIDELKRIFYNFKEIKFITNVDSVMILPLEIDKGWGLKNVLEFYKIKCDEAGVMGDGENDLPMFEIAKYRFTVGNSVESLVKISTFHSEKKYSEGSMEILKQVLENIY